MANNLEKVDDDIKFRSVYRNVSNNEFSLLITFRILDVIELWGEGKNITKDSIDGD